MPSYFISLDPIPEVGSMGVVQILHVSAPTADEAASLLGKAAEKISVVEIKPETIADLTISLIEQYVVSDYIEQDVNTDPILLDPLDS